MALKQRRQKTTNLTADVGADLDETAKEGEGGNLEVLSSVEQVCQVKVLDVVTCQNVSVNLTHELCPVLWCGWFGVVDGLVWWVVWCGGWFGVVGGLVWWMVWCGGWFGVVGGLVWWVVWCGGWFGVVVVWCGGWFG